MGRVREQVRGDGEGGRLPPGFLPPRPHAPDGRYRVLFVHAHPDDESISTGGTIALLSSLGVEVTLLTATRGELGEVIPEDLRHLEQGLPKPGRDGISVPDGGSGLARVRTAELEEAAARLGVRRRMFLGEAPALSPGAAPQFYRDSGMSWGPNGRAQPAGEVLPGSLSLANLNEIASHTAALIRALRPDTVVSYAADGGYGHPDHRRVHEMTLRAVELAAAGGDSAYEAWDVPLLHAISSASPEGLDAGVVIDGKLDLKREAMSAHRTQIVVAGDSYALSDLAFRPLTSREGFNLVRRGRVRAVPSRFRVAVAAVAAGVVVSMLGTMLHSRGWAGWPWGVVAALLLAASTIVFLATWSRSVLMGALTGAATYLGCVLWAVPQDRVGLIQADVVGTLWLYGTAVLTAAFLIGSAVFVRSR